MAQPLTVFFLENRKHSMRCRSVADNTRWTRIDRLTVGTRVLRIIRKLAENIAPLTFHNNSN
jgi:hypothetical protein